MNIQEAYNKGLGDAEAIVIEKFNNVLNGVDAGPFANPELEVIKQRLLDSISDKNTIKILENMINGEDYQYDNSGTDSIIIAFYDNLMKYLLSTVGERNKLGVRMKNSLSKVKFDLTFERNRLN